MKRKDLVRPTRIGRICRGIFLGVVVLGLFSVGALLSVQSFEDGHLIALLLGLACCGAAVLMLYVWKRSSREWPGTVAERIGVPDSLQDRQNAARKTANIPNVLRGQEPPSGAVVVAGRSIWFSRVLLMVALAIAAGLLYLGRNLETIIPEWHGWVDYVFIGIGALLLIAGLWPNNWRKRLLGFIAIREGIYVHEQGVYPEGHERATPDTRWLFVPWANVVDVREGLVCLGSGQGGASWQPSTKLSLRVTPDEARRWFPYADDEASSDGMSRIVSLDYSESDLSPKETVPRLQKLWAPSRA